MPSYCRSLLRTAFIARNSIIPGSLQSLNFICKAWKTNPVLCLLSKLPLEHLWSSLILYIFLTPRMCFLPPSCSSRNFTFSWGYFFPVMLSSLEILHILPFFFFFFLNHWTSHRSYMRHTLPSLFVVFFIPIPFFLLSNTTALLRCGSWDVET